MTEKVVEFRALLLVDKERSSYGLRYNDFERYRKHCANRVHRLRSSLKMTHGKGKEFKKLPAVELEKVTSGHLQLLLFETERAWAFAQELLELFAKSDETMERQKAMGRIRRALSWSNRLLAQSKALLDAQHLSKVHFAEVTLYNLLVTGRFQRVREEFDKGIASLSVARNLLEEFASNAQTSHDQAVASVFIDEVGPEIRHCAHELGHKKAYDIDGIVKEVSPRHREKLIPTWNELVKAIHAEKLDGKEVKRLKDLEWEGEVVPIRNPELVDAFLKVEAASSKLAENTQAEGSAQSKSRKRVTAFDGVLQALSDAEDIARKLAEAKKLSGGTDAGASSEGAGGRDVQFVHAFTTYLLLTRRTQRDLLLVDALVEPATAKSKTPTTAEDPRVNPAVVKIYDTVLQSLNQMRSLPIVDESPDVAAATEARISYIRGARCLFMARTYSHLKRYAEAVSLTQTAQARIREAHYQLSLLSTQDPTPETQYFPLSDSSVSTLEQKIQEDETKMKVDWFAHNGGSAKAESDPSMKKPLFYDIAFNSLEDPLARIQKRAGRKVEKKVVPAAVVQRPVEAKVDEPEVEKEPEPEPARAGVLSSLLGGWWGRR